jgi:hypothetical protein
MIFSVKLGSEYCFYKLQDVTGERCVWLAEISKDFLSLGVSLWAGCSLPFPLGRHHPLDYTSFRYFYPCGGDGKRAKEHQSWKAKEVKTEKTSFITILNISRRPS